MDTYGGAAAARALANEYCRKCQYFYDLWVTKRDEHYVYTAADIAAYKPSEEFTAVLDVLQGRALARAHWLRDLSPHE